MDPGSEAYRDDGGVDPGSSAYQGDAGVDPGSRNALEMVRALWIILIIFLTENGALPISKRTRNSADTMVYL